MFVIYREMAKCSVCKLTYSVFQRVQLSFFLSHARVRDWNTMKRKLRKVNSIHRKSTHIVYKNIRPYWTFRSPTGTSSCNHVPAQLHLLHPHGVPPSCPLSQWALSDQCALHSDSWFPVIISVVSTVIPCWLLLHYWKQRLMATTSHSGKKTFCPDSSCRRGVTNSLVFWRSKLLSWLDMQQL